VSFALHLLRLIPTPSPVTTKCTLYWVDPFKLNQYARKDLGGGFKILVDDNDESRPKFQFVVPKPAAA